MGRFVVAALVLGAAVTVSVSAEAAPPPLPLSEAVAQARRASPLRASAVVLVDGADTAARLAGRLPNPLVDVRGENLAPGGILAPYRDVFATLTQPLELGGKRTARRAIAGADRDVASMALGSVDRQVVLDTVRAYLHGIRARDALETLVMHRDAFATLVGTMRLRVGEGYAPESDLLRFQTEAARLDAEVVRTRLELTRTLADLAVLTGSAAAVEPSQLVVPAAIAAPAIDSTADYLAAISRRADVRLARARQERAERAVAFERLRRLPDPAVTGGYKRTAGQNTAVIGLSFVVPLFDRNGQAIAHADAEARAAALDEAAVRARAIADAQAAVEAARALDAQAARIDRELLVPAEGVRNAAQALFREGAADVLKLVDAERVYADVRREALALRADAYVAAIEARFAIGEEDLP
jgi:cobalt-zinc-cadmium efflux system outer membrane protein